MDPSSPDRDAALRLAQHYVWKDIARRAGGIPLDLLRFIARMTKDDVPPLTDAVAQVEWHIEHVLTIARRIVAVRRAEEAMRMTPHLVDQAVAAAANRQRAQELPMLVHAPSDVAVAHVYRSSEGGPLLGCETRLPALVCDCGRRLIALADPTPVQKDESEADGE